MEPNDEVDTQPEVDQMSRWQLEQLGGRRALEVLMEAGFYSKNVNNEADAYVPTRSNVVEILLGHDESGTLAWPVMTEEERNIWSNPGISVGDDAAGWRFNPYTDTGKDEGKGKSKFRNKGKGKGTTRLETGKGHGSSHSAQDSLWTKKDSFKICPCDRPFNTWHSHCCRRCRRYLTEGIWPWPDRHSPRCDTALLALFNKW